MAKIDEMQSFMKEMQDTIKIKDEENEIFMNMFREGQLKADEHGSISIVSDPMDQQRIKNGFSQSRGGDVGSKTKEQLNFESAQKGSSLEDEKYEDF